ncbi:diacylglycerol/lipid kinase family protein [Streptomyces rhizosphaerihabitans]|uniref:diacylglycerol/lipid kinase family protein n=1 Tax=Streptomyces rhizosphaerihabitans TaxID=1266770 RepID=UPI0021C17C2E|nr:diacylglycerol kinase family protein [Streptomyces rhizosphaerihabitans]MCT9009584.1 diacylglycerol kinase family protein [Streptomyces rhizosphaerihabitans]
MTNPRSGGGKPARYGLVQRAEDMGAQVWMTSAEEDAASVARCAVEEGAQVLGVAGGDGTVSAVAAVAADAGRSLMVVPAGTRNHFARDLGLDVRDPVQALGALADGEPARVDLGVLGPRVFVNNVSFGMYADALLEPGYREDKTRAFAAVAPDYLKGKQWVEACVDTPWGTVEFPQMVLVSNNPYHLATPRWLGRRFSLTTGLLGGIVLKRPAQTPPDLLRHLRSELRRSMSGPGPASEGVVVWSASSVTLRGDVRYLDAGIDGEAVTLPLPVICGIRPGALRVLLPRDRPGIPPEPAPGRPGALRAGGNG